MAIERLIADLLSPSAARRLDAPRGEHDELGIDLAGWLASAPLFRAFAEANRDKIRKKLRGATDVEARRDVRAELLVARLLLADRRIELAFEPGGSTRGGPDFAVTYRRADAFNLEVTRPRRTDAGRTVLAKLRQLPTGGANVLLLAVPMGSTSWDVGSAVRALRNRADDKDEEFFTRRGFAGTRDFYAQFLRLGAVITWSEPTGSQGRADGWVNASARIPVPERALRACLAMLAQATIGPSVRNRPARPNG